MCAQGILNYIAAGHACISAIFWFKSAMVKFEFGFDQNVELQNSMNKSSRLNACGALFAALAVIVQAVAYLCK